ncbi:unnamed protein product [Cuscuta epithymum]|uniref:Gibberellin-regulated protein 14 n=1 Tax=Cuscuta epithymum TaxID=186058 RepID=A0AAV0EK75_9ASTE|nr:unnamed protein product [Cuscuta epithymum]
MEFIQALLLLLFVSFTHSLATSNEKPSLSQTPALTPPTPTPVISPPPVKTTPVPPPVKPTPPFRPISPPPPALAAKTPPSPPPVPVKTPSPIPPSTPPPVETLPPSPQVPVKAPSVPPPTGKVPPTPAVTPTPPFRPPRNMAECGPPCLERCKLHSRPNVCQRACTTCCVRCKCVPPGQSGNKEMCGSCYTSMTTHGGRTKCP